MLVHCSRTVLAAIVWAILISISSQVTSSCEPSFDNSVSSKDPCDQSSKRKTTIDPSQELSIYGTEGIGDNTGARIIRENDAVKFAVVKRHVQSDTTVSTKISDENNVPSETTKQESGVNDEPDVAWNEPVGSLLGAFEMEDTIVTRVDTVGSVNLSKSRRLNRLGSMPTKKLDFKDAESNDSKPTRASNSFASSSTDSETRSASPRAREVRGYEENDPTSGIIPKTRDSNDEIRFQRYSPVNDASSAQNQPIRRAIESFNEESINESGEFSSRDSQKTGKMNFPMVNYMKDDEGREQTFGKNAERKNETMMWILKDSGDKSNYGDSDEVEIFINVTAGKTSSPDVSSNNQDSNDIVMANMNGKENVAMRNPRNKDNSPVSTFSFPPKYFFAKQPNRVTPASRVDHVIAQFAKIRKVSREPSTEALRQISEPPDTRVLSVEMSFPTRQKNEAYEDSTARYYFSSDLSYRRVPSEKRDLKRSVDTSPENEDSFYQWHNGKKRELQKINYPEQKRDGHKFYGSSVLNNETSVRKNDRKRTTPGQRTEKNEISQDVETENNEYVLAGFREPTNKKITASEREFVDEPTKSPDRAFQINGSVVERTLKRLRIDDDARKGGIVEKLVSEKESRCERSREKETENRENQVEKFPMDIRPTKMDLSHERHNEASSSFAQRETSIVKAEASSSSLWHSVRRENNVLDAITRKMEFSTSQNTEKRLKIENATFDDKAEVRGVILSNKSNEVAAESENLSQKTTTDDNAPSDDSSIPKNRGNFVEKIHQLDHVQNVDGETTTLLESPGYQLQRYNVSQQRSGNDIHGDIPSDIPEECEIREAVSTTPYSDSATTIVSDNTTVKSPKVHFNGQRQMAENNKPTTMTSKQFSTLISPIQPIKKIDTDHGFGDASNVPHEHRLENEGFTRSVNYPRMLKNDETHESSIVNRSEPRDSNEFREDDSHGTPPREKKNPVSDEILRGCDTCEIGGIVESAKKKEMEKFIGRERRNGRSSNVENIARKMAQLVENVETSKRTIERDGVTRENEILADTEFRIGNEDSLDNTFTKLVTIDHTRPESGIGEKIQSRNTKTIVRDREPIINTTEVNLIVPEEVTSAATPRAVSTIIEKFRDNNPRVENFLSSNREVDSGELNLRRNIEVEKHGSSIVEFIEDTRNGSRTEFSNNANNIPGDDENFQRNATYGAGNSSGSDESWKTLIANGKTRSTPFLKIESTDPTFYSEESTTNPVEGSRTNVESVELSGKFTELPKTRGKQIKRGFTRKDIIEFSIENATTNLSHDGKSLITDNPKYHDKELKDSKMDQILMSSKKLVFDEMTTVSTMDKTTVTATLTTGDISPGKSLENHKISLNEKTLNSSTETANVSSVDTRNDNADFAGERYNNNSWSESSRESIGNPVLSRNNEHQQDRDVKLVENSSLDTRTLNQTMHDNSTRITATLNQWPVKHSAVVEGDLVLGGLMMVHEREDSVTCGPVMPQGGVQALEAMLYTLDLLNKRDLVPGVKIGAHILDDCDKDTYGLEMAVDFIKGSISNIDGAEYHCNKTAVRKVISGVVGAASSVTSIQVANLLRLFRIPQVSFFSTSPELSNKMRFEYFTRTIPSDHYQVKAMVDIVLVMGWSYVSIIYEESNYGEKAYEELEKLLGKHQICIAVKEKLSKDSGVAEAHVYDNIVLKLLTKPRARGCIIFASDQEVAGVMRAVRRCNATGAFSWIGSDGWSARSLVSDGNEPEMEGTLSVQPQANPVEGFEDYFLNLTVENNRRNPWFVEFWEDHFKCRYPNASQTPYNNYTRECTTKERLTKQNTAFEDQLQFVSDAVLAFAYAFRNMHSTLCQGKPGLCDAMKPTKGIELLSYLRTVEFDGLSGDVFHFDKNGDGPARYNIIHFKQISPGKYKWIRVGKYLEGELRLNMSEIQFRLGHPEAPESVCSLPCEVGQAKKYVEGESCCWHCFNCTQYQIRHVTDEKQCVLCPRGTVPDETHSYCRDIPEEFLRPESGWAIGAMSFSSTGILITLFIGGVFLKNNDTPIVRASGRELSYVLLTGILLCYLVTFALVLRPTDLVCSIQRFSAGFCFTVVYAALLTKTNRISRIFNAGKRSAKRPSFISPRSQLIICSMLVAVQILINGVWMIIDPAKARHHYPTREDNLLVCNSYIDASYMIAFTYPIILIVVCTVYAVLTRKIPEAFNESKHIGFTMYTTCIIWLAFVPLYFATGSHVALRITSMSVTISLSASVTIACLFTPKLYIILIHPERNVRPNMMHHRYNTTKGSASATNASSMMAPVTLTAVTCDQNKAVKKHVITTMDCSTQSEQFEMEIKDQKNGKLLAAVITRSTQTILNNNAKESSDATTPILKDIDENIKISNIGKIGNGPLSQNEVPL